MNQSLEAMAEQAKAEMARHEQRIRLIGELAQIKGRYGDLFDEVVAASASASRSGRHRTRRARTGLANSVRKYFATHAGGASARDVIDALGDSAADLTTASPESAIPATLSQLATRGELARQPKTDGPVRFVATAALRRPA